MHKVEQTINLLKDSKIFYTIIVDMTGAYSYISPSYDTQFAFLGKSLKGEPFYITLHAEDRAVCEAVGAKCFLNPERLHPAVLRKIDGNGGYIHTHWEFRAMFDKVGSPLGVFCLGYNITDHINTHKKLISTQNLVESREEQLKEIGLIQSHNVRKPLANILGLLETLESDISLEDMFQVKLMLQASATELDLVIRDISDRTV